MQLTTYKNTLHHQICLLQSYFLSEIQRNYVLGITGLGFNFFEVNLKLLQINQLYCYCEFHLM